MCEIAALRRALQEPLPGEPAHSRMSPDIRYPYSDSWPDPTHSRNSSVMIMLYPKAGQWYLPLIKRPSYDGVHSGQVCLPGGKWEPQDAGAWDAALRETAEEAGVADGIERLGGLTPIFIPHSNFMVYPQVGWYANIPVFQPDVYEVETLIEAPLRAFFQPENIKSFTYQVGNRVINAPFYDIDGYRVWGATAMIICEFLDVLESSKAFIESESCNVHNAQAPL